jgi:hypothetical protein
MLKNLEYLGEDLTIKTPQKSLILTDEEMNKSKRKKMAKQEEKKVISSKLSSRVNFPLRGGKISLICEEHRVES